MVTSQSRRIRYYGSCAECGHAWREHPGGAFGEPSDGTCGECQYEFSHEQRETTAPACRLPADTVRPMVAPARRRRWWRKTRLASTRPAATTVIEGVSDDPRDGVRAGRTGLYELCTSDGVAVNLHGMTLVSVVWEPVRRGLGLRFEGDAVAVVMEFEGVTILEWGQDNEGIDEAPAEVAGQVADFSYDGVDGFELVTAQSVVGFCAAKLSVRACARG